MFVCAHTYRYALRHIIAPPQPAADSAHLVGVGNGQCRHVDDAAHRRRRRQDVHRLGRAEQYRADRDAAAGRRLQQVVGDVRRIGQQTYGFLARALRQYYSLHE